MAYASIALNGRNYGLRIIGLILTLILLFGITYVALSARAPPFPGAEVAVLIGFVLLIANVTGSLAASAGLPRLTGYLIVGILAGPSVSGMIRGIQSVSVVIFAFFFAVAGARLELAAVREFWLAALIIFSGRVWLTYRGARVGLERAGADVDLRTKTWQGLISQGGVTLGLVLLMEERFPTVGSDIVALGMAVIIGSILGGPILLKWAITTPPLPEPEPGNGEI